MRHPKLLAATAAFSIAGAVAIYVLVESTGPLPGELRFSEWRVDGGYPDEWDRPMSFVTYLADTWVGVASVMVLAAVVAEEVSWRWALLVPVAAASTVFVELISSVLGPTSPEYGGAAGVNLGSDDNFPSGHSVFAITVYGLTAWLAYTRGHRALAGALALPVLLMGPCLALLGNHYPADIVAGYGLGLAWLIGVLVIGERWAGQPAAPKRPLAAAHGDPANL